MFVVRGAFRGCTLRAHTTRHDSFSTPEATGSTCTANTAARAVLRLVISFTQATQNGKPLSEERPEGSATITRLDGRRHRPLEGSRHRSIGSPRAPDDQGRRPVGVTLSIALFGGTPLHQVPVVMIPRPTTTVTFDLDLLTAHPHTNAPLSSHASI